MRLIDADKLLEAGGAVKFSCERYESPNMAIVRQGAMFKKLVQEAPTVNAVPVVHGVWEKCFQDRSKNYFQCSNCHTAYMDGISGAIAPEYGSRAWNHCPHCGAKMDGGKENG